MVYAIDEAIKNKVEAEREGWKAEGKVEGKGELLIKQLTKKIGSVPEGINKRLMELTDEQLGIIGENIFDIASFEDLIKLMPQ